MSMCAFEWIHESSAYRALTGRTFTGFVGAVAVSYTHLTLPTKRIV